MAEASNTSIAILALKHLGAGRITDIDDENDVGARAMRDALDDARDQLLETYQWEFAARRIILAADVAAPAFGYAYSFEKPEGFMCVNDPDPDDGFQSVWPRDVRPEGSKLLTNEGPSLSLAYTYRETNPAKFNALFRAVLAYDMAIVCAPQLVSTGAAALMNRLRGERAEKVSDARTRELIARPANTQRDGSWVRSRSSLYYNPWRRDRWY